MRYTENSIEVASASHIMYIDMNSFFASCEQQDFPELRGKPVGVCTYNSPNACVIAPSIEAKRFGVKTGMRLGDCRALCPHIIPLTTRPYRYREIHVEIMRILQSHCDTANVMAKSIDEAVMNFSTYRLVYPDLKEVARRIKADIKAKFDYITCSIGIGPNSFLAKLGTELKKPDGLIEITHDNIDYYLAQLKLTDLPGIAKNNERRLQMIGIKNPLEMRQASEALLRKAFGGIVGNYWHGRLHFKEIDLYKNDYRAMSATRTVSAQQRQSRQSLDSLLISLCTRLEQRLVKQKVFCKEASFYIKYKDYTAWDTKVRFTDPVQDATELRSYIMERVTSFERSRNIETLFNNKTQGMGVAISNFVGWEHMQYSLFENRMAKDKVRLAMYDIKDRFGKNLVRKACETIQPNEMADAIGFGSVRDMYEGIDPETSTFNKYLLEAD